ncbi:hypothetical protein SCP_0906230 [Sparassis crispa]|uniref:Uncharacterized protein n=1 Tax=Sparassis crispa TaxID=139825 RepID=A0A401GX28_9APHY|nr:hypothetical protein SCP_0906230 [Sparassis crispa]GBE86742.1 hypothetical protein SCP_0906230 [Sparassis crispa]
MLSESCRRRELAPTPLAGRRIIVSECRARLGTVSSSDPPAERRYPLRSDTARGSSKNGV